MISKSLYIGIGDKDVVIAVGEQAGLSVEDSHVVQKVDSVYILVKAIFKKAYEKDRIWMKK